MKNKVVYMVFIVLFFATGCKKTDYTDSVDITTFEWKLKSIKVNGFKTKIKDEEYLNPDAYILIFRNDSTFNLNTSVNDTYGKYFIYNKGEVTIPLFSETTMVDNSDDGLDMKIKENIIKVTSYRVLEGNVLIFKGDHCEMEFEML